MTRQSTGARVRVEAVAAPDTERSSTSTGARSRAAARAAVAAAPDTERPDTSTGRSRN
jgi:hypothetical protein